MGIVALILIVILTVILNILYHKMFDVTYFGCQAYLKEWIICFFISAMIISGIFQLLGMPLGSLSK